MKDEGKPSFHPSSFCLHPYALPHGQASAFAVPTIFQLSRVAARLNFRRPAEAVKSDNFGQKSLSADGVFMKIFSSARRRAFALTALAAVLSNALFAASAQTAAQKQSAA